MATYPGAKAIIEIMGIQPTERVLILSDNIVPVGALAILEQTFFTYGAFPSVDRNLPVEFLDELPEKFEHLMQAADVILLAASQSWYHTTARRKAKYQWHKRIAECYGLVGENLMEGGLTADYKQVAQKGRELAAKFQSEASIRILSERGTDFSCDILDVGFETGQYQRPGAGGNLPAGEVYIAPVPDSANGRIVFDLSMDPYGSLQDREQGIEVEVEHGSIKTVSGFQASILKKALQRDIRISHVAEVAFGTNAWCISGRSILEDEKMLGTAHVGFGNDTYFGGHVSGPHYDGVFSFSKVISSDGKELNIRGENMFG